MPTKKQLASEFTAAQLTTLDKVRLAIRRGQLEDALTSLNQQLAAAPPAAEVYRWRGWVQQELHDRQSARRALLQAVELEPDQPDNHLFLGFFLIAGGKLKWGLAELQQVLAAAPPGQALTQTCAYVGRQAAYQLLGRFDAALVNLNLAIERQPERCLFSARARLYLRLARWTDAAEDFALLAAEPCPAVTRREHSASCGLCYFGPWGLLRELYLPRPR